MRAARYHRYGTPDVLDVEDVPEPHAPDVFAENDSRLLDVAADLGGRGGYRPRVARVRPLSRVAHAHQVVETGRSGGKVVIDLT